MCVSVCLCVCVRLDVWEAGGREKGGGGVEEGRRNKRVEVEDED